MPIPFLPLAASRYSFLEILLCASNIYFRNCGSASVLTSVMVEKACAGLGLVKTGAGRTDADL